MNGMRSKGAISMRRTKRRKPTRQQKARRLDPRQAANRRAGRPPPSALPSLRTVTFFPFRVVMTVIKHIAQVLLSIFIVILHPQFRWLRRLVMRSRLVRRYIRPGIKQLSTWLYEPYFNFLRALPPFWATVSIAIPLGVLEPAKAYATYLIAERPKAGIILWLALQGLSVLLIDKTWTAVRPQARKIWLVSRLHAWGWLNVNYGKHWVVSSPAYEAVTGWLGHLRARLEAWWSQLTMPGRRKPLGFSAQFPPGEAAKSRSRRR